MSDNQNSTSIGIVTVAVYALLLASLTIIGILFSINSIKTYSGYGVLVPFLAGTVAIVIGVSGVGLLRKKNWARYIFLLATPCICIASYVLEKDADYVNVFIFIILTYVPASFILSRSSSLQALHVSGINWRNRGGLIVIIAGITTVIARSITDTFLLSKITEGEWLVDYFLLIKDAHYLFDTLLLNYGGALIAVSIPTHKKETKNAFGYSHKTEKTKILFSILLVGILFGPFIFILFLLFLVLLDFLWTIIWGDHISIFELYRFSSEASNEAYGDYGKYAWIYTLIVFGVLMIIGVIIYLKGKVKKLALRESRYHETHMKNLGDTLGTIFFFMGIWIVLNEIGFLVGEFIFYSTDKYWLIGLSIGIAQSVLLLSIDFKLFLFWIPATILGFIFGPKAGQILYNLTGTADLQVLLMGQALSGGLLGAIQVLSLISIASYPRGELHLPNVSARL